MMAAVMPGCSSVAVVAEALTTIGAEHGGGEVLSTNDGGEKMKKWE